MDLTPQEKSKRRIVRALAALVPNIEGLSWEHPLVGGCYVEAEVAGGKLRGFASPEGGYSLSLLKGASEFLIIAGHCDERKAENAVGVASTLGLAHSLAMSEQEESKSTDRQDNGSPSYFRPLVTRRGD